MPKVSSATTAATTPICLLDVLSHDQRLALDQAVGRPDHPLLPLPEALALPPRTRRQFLRVLLGTGLVEERPTISEEATWRTDKAGQAWALHITPSTVALIVPPNLSHDSNVSHRARVTKRGRLIALLGTAGGATLEELAAELDWLPHTTRAALTRLRQAGHAVMRAKTDGASCYRIDPQQPALETVNAV